MEKKSHTAAGIERDVVFYFGLVVKSSNDEIMFRILFKVSTHKHQ